MKQSSVSSPNAAGLCRQLVALLIAGLPALQSRETLEEQISKLADAEQAQFEAVWSVANRVGGPPAIAFNRLADVFEMQFRKQQEIELAYASPKATAKLVMALPLIALGLAQLVGMNPLRAIGQSILGGASLFAGFSLLAVGHYWSKRMLANAAPDPTDPGSHLDCVVIALQAGLPIAEARAQAEAVVEPSDFDRQAISEATDLSARTGAGLSGILTSAADRSRQILNYEISNRIAKLSVRLMIPLGVAVLPAFVFISIVPIALSLFTKH